LTPRFFAKVQKIDFVKIVTTPLFSNGKINKKYNR
jgi:hypothetical protein